MEKEQDSIEVMKLISSSGKLHDAIENLALLSIDALKASPVEDGDLEGIIEAYKLMVRGLQDPESDLFVDKQ